MQEDENVPDHSYHHIKHQFIVQDTKKCDCPAKIHVVDVTQKTISYWDGKQIISPAFFKNIRCFLKEEMMRKGRCFNEGDWMDEIPKVESNPVAMCYWCLYPVVILLRRIHSKYNGF
ncbi:unnamed protein product [Porites evermanni]|uniref:Uncharacterized protein n=1 Tax=Porites evermanni TaxID=104178 RepID=A0ABN8LIZ2_9CNID|nr:unnamed protein product [Porites evermanni]